MRVLSKDRLVGKSFMSKFTSGIELIICRIILINIKFRKGLKGTDAVIFD